MEPTGARIALFGGSFDPPHTGHLSIARAAVQSCRLDRVIFVPCRQSPLKGRTPGASGPDRVAMLRLALTDFPEAEVSEWELSRPGPSYSWQTVAHFADSIPGARLFWIMGADQWDALERWARPEFLRDHLTFVVFARDGVRPRPRDGWQSEFLTGEFPGSSTEVRELLANSRPAPALLPSSVQEYAISRGLYRPAVTD